MILTVDDIAGMLDLSCVKTTSSKFDIQELAEQAKRYRVGQVSVMQCFIPLVKRLVESNNGIKVVGNVSFPSGSDSTSLKVAQTKELVLSGCDELDMVMNIGKLRSGDDGEVEEDIRAVIEAAGCVPVKVIIETPYLNPDEIKRACEISIRSGASFVKTGTGWAPRGTTLEDVKFVKSIVGNRVKIKASGGIRELDTLVEMYKCGVTRFGVNLASGIHLLEECMKRGGKIEA